MLYIKSARAYQNLQHITSGLQQCIVPVVAATSALYATGKIPMWVAAIPFILTFILGRMASEISYQTSQKMFEEFGKRRTE